MGFSEDKKINNGEEAVFRLIMAKKFLELIEDWNPKSQETQ